MTFEERFPSLKGRQAYPLRYRRAVPSPLAAAWKDFDSEPPNQVTETQVIEMDVYPCDAIDLCLLDKQRVRDAFGGHFGPCWRNHEGTTCITEIMKELGL